MTTKTPFYWLNEPSQTFLTRGGYLEPHETGQSRIEDMAKHAFDTILGRADLVGEFIEYAAQGCYSFASPIWSNFGRAGLPISCNGSYVDDSIEGMMTAHAEIGMMTKHGSGTSAYFGDIRPRGSAISTIRGSTADGPMHYLPMWDHEIEIVSQGSTRRGNMAGYMRIDHPQIMEFLKIRTEESPIQNLHPGVTVTDAWMEAMINGDEEKQKVWATVLRRRYETGYPYIVFIDTVNRNKPDVYKAHNMMIHASNLCVEIALPSSVDESFVCDLSSMNLSRFAYWANNRAVELMVYFLDAVMAEYIVKTNGVRFMERAHRFAVRHRALGLGILGYHTALQKNHVAFESMEAKFNNVTYAKTIYEKAWKASAELAEAYGEPELLKGRGLRNTTVTAIAPTKSSSFILGQVSEGIEPIVFNAGTKSLAKGKFDWRNPHLEQYLDERGKNTESVWRSILEHNGSVQHLDDAVVDAEAKAVFKTFGEISQLEIIQQAAARQKFVCQSQSLNLMIHPKTPVRDTNKLLIEAWKLGVKSLYYQKGQNMAQEMVRDILSCSACEA